MHRTLLLCFIHGFKGDADTFGAHAQFAQDLRQRVAAALPRVSVRVALYPPYDTRGELAAAVQQFQEWLLNQVIDLEVAARTPSPTVDPSVHCVLIGHSMGGIVAADALLALAADKRVGEDNDDDDDDEPFNTLLFPRIQGVLGFDTPFLGIAPGVVAYTAEDRYAQASAALAQVNTLREAVWGKPAAGGTQTALTTTTTSSSTPWNWGKVAAAGALATTAAAAAGLAAYRRRDQLELGWQWATSHLAFVGCLARGEALRSRLARLAAVQRTLGVGFANLYTQLGNKPGGGGGGAARGPRTFCNLPSSGDADWHPAVNDAAADEVAAHMRMFEPATNSRYHTLVADAGARIVRWTADTAWYRESESAGEGGDAGDATSSPSNGRNAAVT